MTAKLEQMNRETTKAGTSHKFSSYLPEVYAGAPNRIERYVAYDQADLDSEINRALDTIAEFCTQNQDDDNPIPFRIIYRGDVTETETELLTDALQQWSSINKFNQRIFKIFRNSIKYGDQFFVRDPETYELLWVDAAKVEKIMVNEAEGKKIDQYVIKDLDFNMESMVATNPLVHDQYSFPGGYPRSSNPASGSGTINYGQPSTPGSRTSRFYNPASSTPVDAAHVVHLSLTDGMDQNWPFGISILEAVYKTYKQKDLLEDCILIYRIVRAPERRVFYIDVGQLQGQRAMQYVERVKNEIYQRRLPSRCLSLDTKIYLLDGRLIPLHEIIQEHNQGKQNWVYSCNPENGEIVPGKITWAGETRAQTQVVKLTLDNGQTVICTPDHKFPILGKGFVEAQNLAIGESFIPAYFRNKNITKNTNDYTQIFDPSTKKWNFVHRMVCDYFPAFDEKNLIKEHTHLDKYKDSAKDVIHHTDFNRFNNNPENLVRMNRKDHICLHGDTSRDQWKTNRENMVSRRFINYDATLFAMMHDIFIKSTTNPSLIMKKFVAELSNNTDFMTYFIDSNSAQKSQNKLKKFTWSYLCSLLENNGYTSWSHYRDTVVQSNAKTIDYGCYKFSQKLFDRFIIVYKTLSSSNISNLIAVLKNDAEFMTEFNLIHMSSRVKKQFVVCNRYIYDLIEYFGYKNFVDFRKQHSNLHWFGNRDQIKKYNFSYDMFNRARDVYQNLSKDIHYTQHNVGFKRLYPALQTDTNFVLAFKKANPVSSKTKFGPGLVKQMFTNFGFDNYEDFVTNEPYLNHKLVSIEWLDTPVNTGTITVDGDEEYHNYHTFAIEGGIFTKNSGGGSGGSVVDTAYNPISMTEDFFLATNNEQRGTKIENLAGGENLGSLDDLHYFNNKLLRGLGIPSSYLPSGPEDGTVSYNDGKIGTAFIQEYRFNKYCQRLQNHFAPTFDLEFKLFLKNRGIEVHSSLFELAFNVPQSFSEYRQMALDSERANLFSQVMSSDAAKYMSKRFALEKYLGLTQEELLENEKLWKEENSDKVKAKTGVAPAENGGVGLGSIGIRPDSGPDFGDEMPSDEDMSTGGEESTAETPDIGGAGGPAPAPETPPQSP